MADERWRSDGRRALTNRKRDALLAVALLGLGAGPFGMQGLEWRLSRVDAMQRSERQLGGAVEEERRRGSLALQIAGSARPQGEPGPSAVATR